MLFTSCQTRIGSIFDANFRSNLRCGDTPDLAQWLRQCLHEYLIIFEHILAWYLPSWPPICPVFLVSLSFLPLENVNMLTGNLNFVIQKAWRCGIHLSTAFDFRFRQSLRFESWDYQIFTGYSNRQEFGILMQWGLRCMEMGARFRAALEFPQIQVRE
jgi:hypothetical protein